MQLTGQRVLSIIIFGANVFGARSWDDFSTTPVTLLGRLAVTRQATAFWSITSLASRSDSCRDVGVGPTFFSRS